MALKSVVNAAKSALQEVVPPPSNNPASDRDEVLQDLHLAEKAWATDGVRSGTWFVRDGEHVAFTPTTRNGATLTIGGQTTSFIPADRFADYLVNMRSAIEAGEFDREIAGALHGSANVGVSCPLLSGPSTMRVWIKEGTTNACEKAQAGREHREAA